MKLNKGFSSGSGLNQSVFLQLQSQSSWFSRKKQLKFLTLPNDSPSLAYYSETEAFERKIRMYWPGLNIAASYEHFESKGHSH